MDKGARLRWGILLSSLGATIVAIIYPLGEPAAHQPLPRVAAKAIIPPTSTTAVNESVPAAWIATEENPFAPRVWEAAQSVLVVPPLQVLPPAEKAAAPAPAPVLPYRFLGQMQNGTERVLYLGRGEQVVLAHQGDVLDSIYKVVAISEGQIEFELIESGIRQTLPIPAQ